MLITVQYSPSKLASDIVWTSFRAPQGAMRICAAEGEAAIGSKVGSKFKVADDAHRCFHRVVRDNGLKSFPCWPGR